jgi:hypothetical protein
MKSYWREELTTVYKTHSNVHASWCCIGSCASARATAAGLSSLPAIKYPLQDCCYYINHIIVLILCSQCSQTTPWRRQRTVRQQLSRPRTSWLPVDVASSHLMSSSGSSRTTHSTRQAGSGKKQALWQQQGHVSRADARRGQQQDRASVRFVHTRRYAYVPGRCVHVIAVVLSDGLPACC